MKQTKVATPKPKPASPVELTAEQLFEMRSLLEKQSKIKKAGEHLYRYTTRLLKDMREGRMDKAVAIAVAQEHILTLKMILRVAEEGLGRVMHDRTNEEEATPDQPEIPALEEATEPSSTAEAPGSTPLVEPETAGVTTTEGISMPFCTAKLKSGRPCENFRNLRNGLCSNHNPEEIKERAATKKKQKFEFEVEQAYDDLIVEMKYGNDEIEGREPTPEEKRQMFHKVCDQFKISYEAGLKILAAGYGTSEKELAILREAGAA